jgi:cytochrome c5
MKPLLTLIFSLTTLFATSGEEIFNNTCASCHDKILSMAKTKDRWERLKAPPMNEVIDRMKRHVPVKDIDIQRHILILFIRDYLENPDILIGLCDPHAYDQFGTMPSFKGKLTKEEIKAVSEWVYDTFEDVGFK